MEVYDICHGMFMMVVMLVLWHRVKVVLNCSVLHYSVSLQKGRSLLTIWLCSNIWHYIVTASWNGLDYLICIQHCNKLRNIHDFWHLSHFAFLLHSAVFCFTRWAFWSNSIIFDSLKDCLDQVIIGSKRNASKNEHGNRKKTDGHM